MKERLAKLSGGVAVIKAILKFRQGFFLMGWMDHFVLE